MISGSTTKMEYQGVIAPWAGLFQFWEFPRLSYPLSFYRDFALDEGQQSPTAKGVEIFDQNGLPGDLS